VSSHDLTSETLFQILSSVTITTFVESIAGNPGVLYPHAAGIYTRDHLAQPNGAEALKVFESSSATVDLLISDIVIPGRAAASWRDSAAAYRTR
jgi:hypothetical protein